MRIFLNLIWPSFSAGSKLIFWIWKPIIKRIKIIKPTSFETGSNKIIDHLSTSLRKLRKSKLAVDVQNGNFQQVKFESVNFDYSDDEFFDEIELTYKDESRIYDRVSKPSKARLAASNLSHLKNAEYDRLAPSLSGM